MFPRPYPVRLQSSINALDFLSHESGGSPVTVTPNVTPNVKQKMKADSTVLSKLGPATMVYMTTFNLTHLIEMVELIVNHNPAPLWGIRLATISISDSDRENLLIALAEDWEAEVGK